MVEKSHVAGFWPQLFDPLRGLGARVADWIAPRAEASGAEDAYTVTLELPGVPVENVEVSAHDGMLTVRGEKRAERTEQDGAYYFTEREYGAFQRSFRLPPDADEGAIAASFKDGVLTVRAPKRSGPPVGARRIEVSTG